MTTAVASRLSRDRSAAGAILVAGIVLATLTEAIASTVLSLGRGYIIADTHATPDEFAWPDIGYIALKLIGFMVAPWLMHHIDPRRLIIASTLVMGTACGITVVTARLDLLIVLRIMQGFSGGILFVAGQTSDCRRYRAIAANACAFVSSRPCMWLGRLRNLVRPGFCRSLLLGSYMSGLEAKIGLSDSQCTRRAHEGHVCFPHNVHLNFFIAFE